MRLLPASILAPQEELFAGMGNLRESESENIATPTFRFAAASWLGLWRGSGRRRFSRPLEFT
jgi:hypothetical protein